MNKCKICGKDTKNKVYCSVTCQYEGYRATKVERIIKICEYCGKEFKVKKTSKHPHRFCSRKCTDLWKKENALTGERHHNYGRKHTKEWKEKASIRLKKRWKQDKKYRVKMIEVSNNQIITQETKEKREKTMLKKYGVKHNWNGKYGDRKCDKTCVEKYGKSSVQLRQDSITKKIWHKRRKSVIENRYKISFEEYLATLPQKEKYYIEVRRITQQQPIHLLENYSKRGRAGENGAYQLDHKIPVSYGFYNNIEPKIIGNIKNLRFITWEKNLSKGSKYIEKRKDEKKDKD